MNEVYLATLYTYYPDDNSESNYGIFSSVEAFEKYFEDRRLDKTIEKDEDRYGLSWKWTENYEYDDGDEAEEVKFVIRLEKKPVID